MRAFTLIELLATVAIVAILLAICLPALGRARDHARDVRCAATLRGFAPAFQRPIGSQRQEFTVGTLAELAERCDLPAPAPVAPWVCARERDRIGYDTGGFVGGPSPDRRERPEYVPMADLRPAHDGRHNVLGWDGAVATADRVVWIP